MISSTMNLVMTILGFAMSATFVVFVCARLLCVRMQQRHHPRRNFDSTEDDVEGRSPRGMEPSVVASFPTVKYSQEVFSSKDDALCTVCLGEYEEKDVLRVLPRCGHAFHVDCIDAWLRHHSTCPICRISLCSSPDGRCIPSPLITQAARSRFSHEAVPDNMFERLQQQQDSCEVRLQGIDMSAQEVEGSSHSHSRRRAGVGEGTEIFLHRSRRQRYAGDLESAIRADESLSNRDSSNSLSQGSRAEQPVSGEVFLVGRRREVSLRHPRSGKWSLWLWRRWERGEPGTSPLAQEEPTVESPDWASTSAAAAAAVAPTAYVPPNFTLRHNAMFAQDGVESATYSPDHALPVAQVVTVSHSDSGMEAMPAQAPPHVTASSNPQADPHDNVAASGSRGG